MLKFFDTDDTPYIVTMDRGYSSFNMFETCNRLDNCFYVIRTKAGNTAINEIKNLPDKEIDTEIDVGELIDRIEYDYPDFHLSMRCFWAEVKSGKLTLLEAEDARWLTSESIDTVDWLPADSELVKKIAADI